MPRGFPDRLGEMTDLPAPSSTDQARLERARKGDSAAFALLWADHSAAALRWARRFVAPQDAEDLAAEAFARVFEALRSGAGPRDILRPYLYTVVKNLAAQQSRKPRETPIDSLDDWAADEPIHYDSVSDWDDAAAAKAFLDLPNRWRTALWYTEVEGMTPAAAAPLLGLAPNAVAALAGRARSALREKWLGVHVRTKDIAPECEPYRAKLAGLLRGSLSPRATERMDIHLQTCASCQDERDRLQDLNGRLLVLFIPILFGLSAAGLATAASGGSGGKPGGTRSAGHDLVGVPVAATSGAAGGTGAGGGTSSVSPAVVLAGAALALVLTTGVLVALASTSGGVIPSSAPEPEGLATPLPTEIAPRPQPSVTATPPSVAPENPPPERRAAGTTVVQPEASPLVPPPPPPLLGGGDFEGAWLVEPYRYLSGESIGPWNVISGQASIQPGGPGPSTVLTIPHYAPVVVDFATDSPVPFLSAVSQTFPSVAGETYQLDFWLAGTGMFQVLRGGTVLESFLMNPAGEMHTTTFTATQSPTDVIVFQSYWPGYPTWPLGSPTEYTAAYVDDVVLTTP